MSPPRRCRSGSRRWKSRVGRLLVKRSSPAVATPEGQVLVQLAEQTALLEHDALHRMGIADEDLPQASIPVAVNHDSLETWFPEAALHLRRRPAPPWTCVPKTRTTPSRCCARARCWAR